MQDMLDKRYAYVRGRVSRVDVRGSVLEEVCLKGC